MYVCVSLAACAKQRCGLTWDKANAKCGKPCPQNSSLECPGEDCFSDLTCSACASTGTPPPRTPPPPGTSPSRYPPGILAKLTALTGMNELQLNNVLGMIQVGVLFAYRLFKTKPNPFGIFNRGFVQGSYTFYL